MLTSEERREQIAKIRRLPAQLRALVKDLTPDQLTTHYLPDEWTVAQNIHHLADAHMNSFVLFKLMLSEEKPPLKGYNPDAWANMADANHADLEPSLCLLEGLHQRWAQLLESLTEADFARVGVSARGERLVDDYLRIYGNHGEAHIDQIQRTLAAQG
jgi:hypothetical protein